MKRDSFVFYASFFEAIKDADDSTRLSVYDAICRRALYGDEADVTGVAKMMYIAFKPQIDANTKKWFDGMKGGRKKNHWFAK